MAGRRRLFDINAVPVGIGHEQALLVPDLRAAFHAIPAKPPLVPCSQ